MTINKTNENDTFTLELEGRLDTTSAPLLENELVSAFNEAKKITLDFTKLAYVSSAGLRALLVGQKTAEGKGASMTISGVSQEIMEIFEMTGFSDMLTIA